MTGSVAGLVLAAGEGKRFGGPKALVRDAAGVSWVARAVEVLVSGGVSDVTVVVGAASTSVRSAVPSGADVVEAVDWREGMGASLRAGLAARESDAGDSVAAMVMLVDTPDVGADVVRRLVAVAGPDQLARAAYAGAPGHPVLLGRHHWEGVISVARGDRGARDYLADREVALVECGDIGSGRDIDTPSQWER